MPRKPGLRVVDPAADPPPTTEPEQPKTVSGAFESGDRRAILTAMAARLARALDDPKTLTKDISPLSRRLQEVTKELESLAAAAAQDAAEATATPDERWEAI